jgi:hypothetical protein
VAVHASFASALDVLLIVSGVLALVGAAGSGLLIRRRDFVVTQRETTPVPTEALGSTEYRAIFVRDHQALTLEGADRMHSIPRRDFDDVAPPFNAEPLRNPLERGK